MLKEFCTKKTVKKRKSKKLLDSWFDDKIVSSIIFKKPEIKFYCIHNLLKISIFFTKLNILANKIL